jgi:hypothetical protein
MDHLMMMKRGVMLANYGHMPPFFLAIKLKTLIKMSMWCMCAFITVATAVLSSFWHHHGLYAFRTADLSSYPIKMYRSACRIASIPSLAQVSLATKVGNDCRGSLPTNIIQNPPMTELGIH